MVRRFPINVDGISLIAEHDINSMIIKKRIMFDMFDWIKPRKVCIFKVYSTEIILI